mgnify:CR=1 FL=1
MALTIRLVRTRRDLRTFIDVPFRIYEGNPYWVPPLIDDEVKTLRTDINPVFDFCRAEYWIAERDGVPVGRIAGIVNDAFNRRWNSRHARFGWIDFIDDPEVSALLFKTVEDWARGQGLDTVHGPLGFTDMDHQGMLVEGFNELGTMATIYNHPYYPVHVERLGYGKDADWVEYEVAIPKEIPDKVLRVAGLVLAKRKLHVFEAKRPADLLPYAREMFELINSTFDHLYGYVTLTPRVIDSLVEQYFPNVDPDFLKLMLDEQNKVAGVAIAFPSLSRALQRSHGRLFPFGWYHLLIALKRPKYADLYLGAVRKDLQGKGADALLMIELNRSFVKRGINRVESNPELESNMQMRGHWKNFEHRQHKRRRCYVKKI